MNAWFYVEAHQESFTGIGAHWIVKQRHGTCGCGAEDMVSRVALFQNKGDAALFCYIKNQQLPPMCAPGTANASPAEAGTHAGGKKE
jgi:hypothetical protein